MRKRIEFSLVIFCFSLKYVSKCVHCVYLVFLGIFDFTWTDNLGVGRNDKISRIVI